MVACALDMQGDNMGGVSLEPMLSVFPKAARQNPERKAWIRGIVPCGSLVPRLSCVGTRRLCLHNKLHINYG